MKSITAFVVRAISVCAKNAWPVIGLSVLLAVLASWYAATHFSMTTDINQLISPNIDWRQREARFEKAFPQFELIVAVVDAPTPELATLARAELADKLTADSSRFKSVSQPGGSQCRASLDSGTVAPQSSPALRSAAKVRRLLFMRPCSLSHAQNLASGAL